MQMGDTARIQRHTKAQEIAGYLLWGEAPKIRDVLTLRENVLPPTRNLVLISSNPFFMHSMPSSKDMFGLQILKRSKDQSLSGGFASVMIAGAATVQ